MNKKNQNYIKIAASVVTPLAIIFFLGIVAIRFLSSPEEPIYSNFTYKVVDEEKKEAIITKYSNVTGNKITSVTIPEFINNYQIIGIGESAFENSADLEKVVMPNSIESVGTYAFRSCYRLTSISFSNNLKYVDNDAFYGAKWYDAKIQNKETIIYTGNVLYEVSLSLTGKLSVRGGTTAIANHAANGASISELVLPSSLSYIGEKAFASTLSLSKISVPNNFIEVKPTAFDSSFLIDGQTGDFSFLGAHIYKYKGLEKENIVIPECYGILEGVFAASSLLKTVQVPSSLKFIGDRAFENSPNLTSINLTTSVVSIGVGAFKDCTSLSSISLLSVNVIPENSFSGCSSLTNVSFSLDLSHIEKNAFSGCILLDNLTFSNGLQYIGSEAFANCQTLKTINFAKSSPIIRNHAFYNSFFENNIINSSAEYYINQTLFKAATTGSTAIKSDTIHIAPHAFENNNQLTRLDLPSKVLTIGDYAFANSSINELILPTSLTHIGAYSFQGCKNLSSLFIEKNVIEIGSSLFLESGIKTLEVSSSNKNFKIADEALLTFDGSVFLYNFSTKEDIVIKNTVVIIRENAFSFSKVKNIMLPNSLTVIKDRAFKNALSLEKISFPMNETRLSTLGKEAFANCANLKYNDIDNLLTLPASIKSVGADAFAGETSFTRIKVNGSAYFYDTNWNRKSETTKYLIS